MYSGINFIPVMEKVGVIDLIKTGGLNNSLPISKIFIDFSQMRKIKFEPKLNYLYSDDFQCNYDKYQVNISNKITNID